jgi:hypothetical protein
MRYGEAGCADAAGMAGHGGSWRRGAGHPDFTVPWNRRRGSPGSHPVAGLDRADPNKEGFLPQMHADGRRCIGLHPRCLTPGVRCSTPRSKPGGVRRSMVVVGGSAAGQQQWLLVAPMPLRGCGAIRVHPRASAAKITLLPSCPAQCEFMLRASSWCFKRSTGAGHDTGRAAWHGVAAAARGATRQHSAAGYRPCALHNRASCRDHPTPQPCGALPRPTTSSTGTP